MKLILTLAAFLMLAGSAHAQASAQINNPLSSVREDFNEASVVARVNMLDTRLGGGDDYAFEFVVFCRVNQIYKGNLKSGRLLKFAARADKGFDHTKLRGDAIVFLTSFINRTKGPFQILPGYFSIHEYSQELVAKIRRVSRASHRRHNNRKSAAR